ncbi:Methyltransferase type 11 [Cordyceps militaris CM01]|uniref:Methyltransferase type 11 n=1 Tax=Cordyceps militaris (strain CM01) TaxID=983644 RepID=G3JL83_CORMM|nr:Methyltransferase type 11 [Cordyceps militaris CM01]EGX90457.1 Methyltransferase type 11 [Cordyceps militaris CM01]
MVCSYTVVAAGVFSTFLCINQCATYNNQLAGKQHTTVDGWVTTGCEAPKLPTGGNAVNRICSTRDCLTDDEPRPMTRHPKRKLSAGLALDTTHWSHTCMGASHTYPGSHIAQPCSSSPVVALADIPLTRVGRFDDLVDWLLDSGCPSGEPHHPICPRLDFPISHATDPMMDAAAKKDATAKSPGGLAPSAPNCFVRVLKSPRHPRPCHETGSSVTAIRYSIGTINMAQVLRASPNSFQPAEPSLGRRQKRQLNPILEEDSDDDGQIDMPCQNPKVQGHAWFSPMSDHFPTPRGVNFLSAPILPSSPSTVSADSSPMTSSNPWNNRASTATDNTEFEDIYDVSDDEDDFPRGLRRSMSLKNDQQVTAGASKFPGRLVIPSSHIEEWSAVDEFKKITSPVPLTPSAQLPMSPAQISFMGLQQALHIPSAPPSLDGSLTSEQLAAMSSPPTPIIGNDEVPQEENWPGVRLQPGALATLHTLSSNDSESEDEASQALEFAPMEMRPVSQTQQLPFRLMTDLLQPRPSTSNATRQSLLELSKLDIPSPGGFFSDLSPRARNKWHLPSESPAGMPPPTSTTAEQFYRCPWNVPSEVPPVPSRPDSAEGFYRISGFSSEPVEHIIEVPYGDDDDDDDMPTARPIIPTPKASVFNKAPVTASSPDVEEAPTEIVIDYDPAYARKQQKAALSNLDRTEHWLLAQRSYLKGVDEPDNGALQTIAEDIDTEEPEEQDKATSESQKKVVRFSHILPTVQPKRLPSTLGRQESAYYRAFQDYIVRAQRSDVFIHQLPRFEALQSQRVGLREVHLNQLLGKYQLSVVPQSAKKRLSANVVRGDLNLTDDPEKIRKEKELEAMNQIAMPSWHVAAVKFLNGGQLIRAPITKRLARISMHTMSKDGQTRDRSRILDLGGQSTGDWAWHCALQYPNTKIYTVTTKTIRQLSNANIHGPPNHRQVAVEKFNHLPFPDNHFDLISARELHSILKFVGENGEDEWETCTRECMRVLKPGGYLEFSILDSDIMNAGPLGLAKSVEFGFSLKTLGYDPSPSKLWLRRLARAGFSDTRRAWVCLPMGAQRNFYKVPAAVSGASGKRDEAAQVHQMEGMTMGGAGNIAGVCSIVGGWSWERWLLRCEMEKVAGELRLADTVTVGESMREAAKCLKGVHDVMEEGRGCRSGFRMLNGYARKPFPDSASISIGFSG